MSIGHSNLQKIRGYQLRECIGAGGFGEVYRAHQTTVDREVAIKIILPAYANHPDFIRSFESEARLIARLEHPHIVPLYDYWREPDGAYLVMRWLPGGNLRQSLQEMPWKPQRASRMLDQIASALALAHNRGVVHRDLKPENILLDEAGNAYLTDFGVAKDLFKTTHLTEAGTLKGSLDFISPEQVQGDPISPQSDIYSLGIVMFELLTGEHPFPGDTPAAQLFKHVSEPIPSIHVLRPDLPEGLDEVIQRATDKQPEQRYADALAFAAAFRGALDRASVDVPTPETILLTAEPENPYKGLRAFEEADAADFFGRETLTQQLLSRLEEDGEGGRFLAVVGPSGSGKSSVVKAGLLPALRQGELPGSENWFVVSMVPGTHPMDELEIGLLRVAVSKPPSLMEQLLRDERGLQRSARIILPADESELLLIIDQFEELFTRSTDRDESKHLLQSIYHAVTEPRSRVRVIITLRADFYDRPLMHPEFSGLMRNRTEVVIPLTVEELSQAIRKPAERIGVALEPGLVPAIVADVSEQPGALPMLQYALTELFERREDHTLTHKAYQAIGGVSMALARRAEEVYNDLDEISQATTRHVFLRLVTLGEGVEDTRRRVLQSELTSIQIPASTEGENPLQRVVDQFGSSRLLLFDRDPATRAPTVEVAHEALLREWVRLREWLDESRADLRMQRVLGNAAEDWVEADHDPSYLVRGSRLTQYEAWIESTDLALTKEEGDYLDASLAERRARQAAEAERRAREAALQEEAELSRQNALRLASIGLAAQALAQMGTANSERGVLLAMAALEEYPYTPQAEAALARAVQESLPYKRMIDGQGIGLDGHWVDWSPDGKRIALGTTFKLIDGEHGAVVFDFESGEVDLVLPLVIPPSENAYPNEVSQINWSPDGTKLAMASNSLTPEYTQSHNLNIYDSITGDLLLELDTQGEFAVDWSLDGARLLTGGENGMVRVWDAQSGEVLREMVSHNSTDWEYFPGTKDYVIAARYSPDGKRAASLSFGGSVHIWDTTTGELLRILEHPPVVVTDKFNYTGANKVALAWSPGGDQLATAWYDGVARIWDVDTGEISRLLVGHTNNLVGVDWSPDGAYLLTQGRDSTARLWAASSGQMVLKLPTAGCGNTAWSNDGRWIAVPTKTGLLAWDTSVLPPVLNTSTPVEFIWEGLWTPDGKLLVLSGYPAMVFDWAGDKIGRQIGQYNLFFAISPDSTRVVAADVSDAKKAQVFDLYTGEVLSELSSPIPDHPQSQWASNSWSNDGTMVASASYPVYLTVIWDPDTGEELARTETVDGLMLRPQFSPDDSLLAAPLIFAEGNSPVYLIDTATGEILRELPSEDGWSRTAMWSPDGKTLAVGYQSGVIKLWDTERWTVKLTFDAHQSQIHDVNWSPDGKRIISAEHENGVAHIWEAATGEVVATWDMKGLIVGGLNDVDWSPDGQCILLHGEGDLPFIRRAWQSTEELIDYAYECCVWRELTPAERQQFGLPEKP